MIFFQGKLLATALPLQNVPPTNLSLSLDLRDIIQKTMHHFIPLLFFPSEFEYYMETYQPPRDNSGDLDQTVLSFESVSAVFLQTLLS